MQISKDTKVDIILKHDKRAIDTIASINKNFKKLRNPVLRNLLAPRVKIKDAARIGNIHPNLILGKLQNIGFDVVFENENIKHTETNSIKLNAMKNKTIVTLDVRPILDKGTDPFDTIMETLKKIDGEKETLLIVNTFEPIPLLNILKKKSYEYETERPEDGLVNVYVTKSYKPVKDSEQLNNNDTSFEDIELKFKGRMNTIDVRDLEMPLPMVTILENIEQLKSNMALYVHHKKLPQYLLPELKDRSYTFASKTIDENNIKLIIYKS